MQNIIRLVQKFQVVLLFLLLQLFCFLVLISGSNAHHRSSFASSSNAVSGTLFTFTNDISSYFHLKEESQQLVEQDRWLKEQLYNKQIEVGKYFIKVDDTIFHQQYEFLPARVIKRSKSSRLNFLTINAGAENNVHGDLGVIGTKGVVGFTVASSESYTTVKPIINEGYQMSIRHRNSKSFGKLIWAEDDSYMTATVVDIPSHVAVDVGDYIETDGSAGLFPEGIPVGKVISAVQISGQTYQLIKIGLIEDFSSIYNVDVIRNTKRIEQEELEQTTQEQFNPNQN